MRQTSGDKLSFAEILPLACAIIILVAFLFLPWIETGTQGAEASFTGEDLLSRAISNIPTPISAMRLLFIPLSALAVEGLLLWSIIDARVRQRIVPIAISLLGLGGIIYFILYFSSVDYAVDISRSGLWLTLLAMIGLVFQGFPPSRPTDEVSDYQPDRGPLIIQFISILFLFLGISSFAFLGTIFNNNTAISAAISGDAAIDTIIWVAIRSLGFVFPLLLICLGMIFLLLARKLWQHNIQAALWARQFLFWLIILFGVLIIQSLIADSLPGVTDGELTKKLDFTFVWSVMLVVSVMAFVALRAKMQIFTGKDDKAARSARTSLNFLMPTLIILGVIAIYPLEQIFISSFSNEEFATSSEIDFVGMENYSELLGIRLDSLPCEQDEDTSQCETRVDSDGNMEIIRVSPLRHLGDGYRGFRPVTSFEVGDSYVVLSARDPIFIKALWDTTIFTIVSVFLELVLGLMLAMILLNKFRGVGMMRVVILIPWAVPTIVSTLFWDMMLRGDQSGLINDLMLSLGLIDRSQSWLTDPGLQLPVLILVDVWKTTPSMAIMLMPGLLLIPKEIYQAAEVDGAGAIRRLFSITLPLMMPIIAVATIFRMLNAIRVFDIFQLLVGRSRYSLATYTQDLLVHGRPTGGGAVGYSSALGIVIFLIIILFVFVYLRMLKVDRD